MSPIIVCYPHYITTMWTIAISLTLNLLHIHRITADTYCPCSNATLCAPVIPKHQDGIPSVVMYSTDNVTWTMWPWPSHLGTVIAVDRHDPALLCHAHTHGVSYGILVTKMHFPQFGIDHDRHKWMEDFAMNVSNQHQDVIFMDIDAMFGQLGVVDLHAKVEFAKEVTEALKSRKPNIKVGVLHRLERGMMSLDSGCDHVRSLTNEVDYIIMMYTSDSQSELSNIVDTQSQDKETCIAIPPEPYISVLRNFERYTSCGIAVEQLILQVTWQGQDHICHRFNIHNDTCFTNSCSQRNTATLPDLMAQKGHVMGQRIWNVTFKTPYYNYFSKEDSLWHQVWYEDAESLQYKYTLAKDTNIAGIAVWHGDSLNYTQAWHSLTREMWAELIDWNRLQDDHSSLQDWGTFTGEMTGLAFGLFILGTLLGGTAMFVLLSQCGNRHRRRFQHMRVDEESQGITSAEVH